MSDPVRCRACQLNQYPTARETCRRCGAELFEKAATIIVETPTEPPAPQYTFAQRVARELRTIRRMRGLSQRQLKAATGQPRTYFSKLENSACTPSVESLFRVLVGIGITPYQFFLRVEGVRNSSIWADPFLSEIAPDVAKLTNAQRGEVLRFAERLAREARGSV